jgi:uncharacterized protein YdaU (DUF1376 family)
MSIVHIAFYPSDWLAGTRGLSDAETGVYITLICKMYEMAGPIERDDDRLWRVCGCKSKAAYLKSFNYLVSEGMVIESQDGLFNEKVQKELNIVVTKSSKAKAAAESRWKRKPNKIKRGDDADASPKHMPQPCQPEPEPEPEEEKKAYAPLAEAKGADEAPADIPSKPKKTPSRGTRLSAEWYLPKAWGDWALDAGASMEMVRLESDVFKDHWLGKSGKDGTKADWLATWRNWIRRAIERNGGTTNGSNSRNSTERSERILGAAAAGTTAKDWG